MSKSQRLRLRDVRGVFRLLGECCELGADPLAWRQHMVKGVCRILGAQVALYQELVPANCEGPQRQIVSMLALDSGWTNSDRRIFSEFWARNAPELCPWFRDTAFNQVFHPRGRLGAFSRDDIISPMEWYRSEFFNDYVRRMRLDHVLLATHDCGADGTRGVVIHRGFGDRPFETRDKRLLKLFFAEQSQQLGVRLANRGALSVATIPLRLRDVLLALIEGDSEKQIALRLGISRHTVHEHIKRLHRHFGASSRGELLSRCSRFRSVLDAYQKGGLPALCLVDSCNVSIIDSLQPCQPFKSLLPESAASCRGRLARCQP